MHERYTPNVRDDANGTVVCDIFHLDQRGLEEVMATVTLDSEERMESMHERGTLTGKLFGIIVFLLGIGLLVLTFKLAIDMFQTPPSTLFGLEPGKTLDLSKAATLLMGVIVKVLLLLVMAIVGGVIANRGVHMYADSGGKYVPRALVLREKEHTPEREERAEKLG